MVDVVGRTRLMKGTFLPGVSNGIGDVSAVINGRFISWEIKVGRDRQRKEQKQFQQEIEQSGGIYLIVKTFDQFLEQYKTIIK